MCVRPRGTSSSELKGLDGEKGGPITFTASKSFKEGLSSDRRTDQTISRLKIPKGPGNSDPPSPGPPGSARVRGRIPVMAVGVGAGVAALSQK